MNGVLDDSLISSLLAQPILVWSLAMGFAILIIALVWGVVYKIRARRNGRFSPPISKIDLAQDSQQAEKIESHKSVKMGTDDRVLDDFINDNHERAQYQPTTITANEQPDVGSVKIQSINGTSVDEESKGTDSLMSESEAVELNVSDSSKSVLATIFEDQVIIDPHVQAMYDNLAPVDISKLQEEAQSIIQQLREKNGVINHEQN